MGGPTASGEKVPLFATGDACANPGAIASAAASSAAITFVFRVFPLLVLQSDDEAQTLKLLNWFVSQ
jgi:hypothetical protein